MTMQIPGYRLGDPTLAASPVSTDELAMLQAAVLFSDDDRQALRQAGELLAPQVEEILDVWYGFVGSHPFLLASFTGPNGPDTHYLGRVRARFGQWILDTCRAEYDEGWLAYAQEIGRRHVDGKNETDGVVGTPPLIPHRYLTALIYPIFATIRPFLEKGAAARSGIDAAAIDRMHQAWLKSLILQVTLWSRPYLAAGRW